MSADREAVEVYDHLPVEELVREVERIAVAVFLWQPPMDGDIAGSWEVLMAKQQAARSALEAAAEQRGREAGENRIAEMARGYPENFSPKVLAAFHLFRNILESFEESGCTDGYCVLRGPATGMHTNGGCRCLNELRRVHPLLPGRLGHLINGVRVLIQAAP